MTYIKCKSYIVLAIYVMAYLVYTVESQEDDGLLSTLTGMRRRKMFFTISTDASNNNFFKKYFE